MTSASQTLIAVRSSDCDRLQRIALLTAIIIAHLLVLLWIITQPATQQPPQEAGRGLVLISLSNGERAASPPTVPKPPPPSLIPPPPIILPSLPSAPSAVQSLEPAGTGAPLAGEAGGCALAVQTAETITKDPAAMAELAALPPVYRTPADAVMLWNGEWLTTPVSSSVTPTLRRAVEQVIAAAAPECRDAQMGGPQFLAIPDRGRITTLVIGSGRWRWSDLLSNGPACVPGSPDACPAMPPKP